MWQTVCVAVIVAIALAAAMRSFYRMLTGKNTGCDACTGDCASCPPDDFCAARDTGSDKGEAAAEGVTHAAR